VSGLLDFLGEEGWPVSGEGECPDYLTDSLSEEGWPVSGVGECPGYLTFLVRKVGQLG
jgi:hypothetical protein